MSNQEHPAIAAYAYLRDHTDDPLFLQFALLQQLWIDARSQTKTPSEYSLVLCRAMTYALLRAKGYDEAQVRAHVVDAMHEYEAQYQHWRAKLQKQAPAKGPRQRTRWPGGGVVVAFDPARARRRGG